MIRKWLQSMFDWPCEHEWETLVNSGTWSDDWGQYGNYWLYRCTKCCKRKRINGT